MILVLPLNAAIWPSTEQEGIRSTVRDSIFILSVAHFHGKPLAHVASRARAARVINNASVGVKIARATFLLGYSARNRTSRRRSVENHFRREQITETDVTQRCPASMRAISTRLCTGDTSCDDFLRRRDSTGHWRSSD